MKSRKGKGIPFNLQDVSTLGATAKLFNGDNISIAGKQSVTHQKILVGGKQVPYQTDSEPLKRAFLKIRKLFDESGMTIAERATPKSRLLSTGKGKTKEYHSPKEMDIYWALEAKKRTKN